MIILGNELSDPTLYIKLTALMLFFLAIILLTMKNEFREHHKKFLFYLIVIPVLLSTFYLAGHTVYKNVVSETGGPVHWHMDYQVWACGEQLNLVDPKGFRNKVGSPLFHEHNDNRIHVEGTVKKLSDISYGKYFEVVGGSLTDTSFSYDVEGKGIVSYQNGDLCNGEPGTLKVFVNGQKIEDPGSYLMYPHALVPPGDCAIVEFSPGDSETTQYICDSWAANEWDYDNYVKLRGGAN